MVFSGSVVDVLDFRRSNTLSVDFKFFHIEEMKSYIEDLLKRDEVIDEPWSYEGDRDAVITFMDVNSCIYGAPTKVSMDAKPIHLKYCMYPVQLAFFMERRDLVAALIKKGYGLSWNECPNGFWDDFFPKELYGDVPAIYVTNQSGEELSFGGVERMTDFLLYCCKTPKLYEDMEFSKCIEAAFDKIENKDLYEKHLLNVCVTSHDDDSMNHGDDALQKNYEFYGSFKEHFPSVYKSMLAQFDTEVHNSYPYIPVRRYYLSFYMRYLEYLRENRCKKSVVEDAIRYCAGAFCVGNEYWGWERIFTYRNSKKCIEFLYEYCGNDLKYLAAFYDGLLTSYADLIEFYKVSEKDFPKTIQYPIKRKNSEFLLDIHEFKLMEKSLLRHIRVLGAKLTSAGWQERFELPLDIREIMFWKNVERRWEELSIAEYGRVVNERPRWNTMEYKYYLIYAKEECDPMYFRAVDDELKAGGRNKAGQPYRFFESEIIEGVISFCTGDGAFERRFKGAFKKIWSRISEYCPYLCNRFLHNERVKDIILANLNVALVILNQWIDEMISEDEKLVFDVVGNLGIEMTTAVGFRQINRLIAEFRRCLGGRKELKNWFYMEMFVMAFNSFLSDDVTDEIFSYIKARSKDDKIMFFDHVFKKSEMDLLDLDKMKKYFTLLPKNCVMDHNSVYRFLGMFDSTRESLDIYRQVIARIAVRNDSITQSCSMTMGESIVKFKDEELVVTAVKNGYIKRTDISGLLDYAIKEGYVESVPPLLANR